MFTEQSAPSHDCATVARTPADILTAAGIRCTPYALAVAEGRQSLSGADLKGKASRYGGSYHATRCAVVAALEAKGWAVVRLPSGRVELRDKVPEGATIGKPCAVSPTVWNLPRA
jgi:hypothetical protein